MHRTQDGAVGIRSRLDREESVLIVIDIQNDFCHPRGAAAQRGRDLSAVEGAVTSAIHVIEAARLSGVPVVFVQTLHGYPFDSPEWGLRYSRVLDSDPALPVAVEGSWGANFYRVVPAYGEPVVVKHRYSAFSNPELSDVLTALGRRSVIFAGVATNVCVESSLRSAVDQDFLGSLVTDACAAYDPREHAEAVSNVRRHFGYAATANEVMAHWAGAPGGSGAAPAPRRE